MSFCYFLSMTDIEIWKDIKDYEGLYQVSNWGRVKNLKTKRIMRGWKTKSGYRMICLCKEKRKEYFYIHRLVGESFLPNLDNKPQINHKIEGDIGKTINMVIFNEDGTVNKEKTTIEWVTAKENCNYGTHNEKSAMGRSKKVFQFSLDGTFIKEWSSASEIERKLGFYQGGISMCCLGKCKSAYGFLWKYS